MNTVYHSQSAYQLFSAENTGHEAGESKNPGAELTLSIKCLPVPRAGNGNRRQDSIRYSKLVIINQLIFCAQAHEKGKFV